MSLRHFVDNRPALYGILGHPLSHTLSPPMQQAAFDAARRSARYVPFDVPPAQLARAIRLLRCIGAAGFNVTVPHKERVLRYLDRVDRTARAIGAVNTVVRRGTQLVGYNTDVAGLLDAWREMPRLRVRGATAFLLGAGGAARAVLWALRHARAARVVLTNRTPRRASSLQRWARRALPQLPITVAPWRQRACELARQHPALIVNATSLGLHAGDSMPVALAAVPRACAVYDLAYRRPTTAFIVAARRRGLLASDGRSMLLYQGARAFTLWTGQSAPLPMMRRALYGAHASKSA